MALLFYRRPDYLRRNKSELSEIQCNSYLERAESSRTQIPARLSFEEIVKNNTLPPCSLNDFMDYLMYVEYDAECLQFFLWYCGYVERWSQLPQETREMSPVWSTSRAGPAKRKHFRSSSFTEKTERFNRILAILEKSPKPDTMTGSSLRRKNSTSTNFSWPRSPSFDTYRSSSDSSRHSSQSSESWPFVPAPKSISISSFLCRLIYTLVLLTYNFKAAAQQPFRDEISRVLRHYITTDAPRQLNLTHQDRTLCLQASAQTTHPSALLPAFTAVEALMRGQCHPNFIRWSISNSNRPRVFFVRGLATALILLGFLLEILLILSGRADRLVRLTAVPLWSAGLALLIAARHGICIILHWNYRRTLRPWEQFADDDVGSRGTEGEAAEEETDEGKAVELGPQQKAKGHRRNDTDSSVGSTSSRVDPFHKQSLQSFGAANVFDAEPWVGLYHEKSLWRRVFDVSITSQNKQLRAMQDRIVFQAVLSGSLVALALGIGSVFVPSPGLF